MKDAIRMFLFRNLTELAATGYFFMCVGVLVFGIASCKCPPGELDADERTPTTAVECYDQAFAIVRECRAGIVGAGSAQVREGACVKVLDHALDLCDRHYGQPYHNGNTPEYLLRPPADDDTDTGDGDAL
jgi:hypothetical protein